jgi:hypothetical protein
MLKFVPNFYHKPGMLADYDCIKLKRVLGEFKEKLPFWD